MSISPAAGPLPGATYSTAYTEKLTATETAVPNAATDTVDWTVSAGTLPAGLKLGTATSSIVTSTSTTSATTDTITGTPTVSGSYSFSVTATDTSTSATATNAYTLVVSNAAVNSSTGGSIVLSPAGASAASVFPGQTGQAATSWSFELAPNYTQFSVLAIDLGPNGTTSCQNATDYVGFSATPTVTVASNGTTQTKPTITASLAEQADDNSTCTTAGVKDQLLLTVGNTSTATSGTPWTVTLTGITYNVGGATTLGAVGVSAGYTHAAGTTTSDAIAPNATVAGLSVTANSPAVSVSPNATDQAISNIVITEATKGQVTTGYVCATASGGTFTGTPSIAASGGGAIADSAAVSGATASFDVTTASSTAPATYTLSGLAVDAPSTPGPVTVTITDGNTSGCSGGTSIMPSAVRIYSVLGSTRIFGQTDNGTAAAELESQFPYSGTSANCPTSVVLATNSFYSDALAASYLAHDLGTGILLTSPGSLPNSTLSALRLEGIQNVFVVGGPLVVNNSVISQLKATPSYTCGGTTARTTLLGTAEDLNVTQIYGQTEYGTAEKIAEYPGAAAVGMAAFPGAYGSYNDTTGNSSPSGSTVAVRTAVVATGQNFPDAMSASGMAYNKSLPVLLTATDTLSPQAQAALTNLGIQQVILMGGPIAVSNSVATSIESMGISVLRIAGQDYTDTAQQLAQFEMADTNSSGAVDGLDWSATNSNTVALARGDFYTDALAGSVVTGKSTAPLPLLLTENPSTLGKYTTGFLNTAGTTAGVDGLGTAGQVYSITTFGGPLAIQASTLTAALNAISAG